MDGFKTPESNDLMSMYSKKEGSGDLLDIYRQKDSAEYKGINIRASNYGNMSIVDKMRGIESNRLNIDGDVTLAEMYSDKSLDRRFGGGMYNVTIADIYLDNNLYKEHHKLNTDGKIEIKENYAMDIEDINKKKEMGGFEQRKSDDENKPEERYEAYNFREHTNNSFISQSLVGSAGSHTESLSDKYNKKSESMADETKIAISAVATVSKKDFLTSESKPKEDNGRDIENSDEPVRAISFRDMKVLDFGSGESKKNKKNSNEDNEDESKKTFSNNNYIDIMVDHLQDLKDELFTMNIDKIYKEKDGIVIKYLNKNLDKKDINKAINMEIIKKSF